MPYSECVQVAEEKGIYLDWLILGVGPKSRDQLEEPWHPYLATPDPEEREIITELKKLPSDVKHELLENARMKGKVYQLEEAVEQLKSEVMSIAESAKDERK